MKRLEFLKRLGIGVTAAVVTPKMLAEMPEKETYPAFNDKLINKRINELKKYPMLWDVCIDKKNGDEWVVSAKANRRGLNNCDMTIITLRPRNVKPGRHGVIPVKRLVPVCYFSTRYKILSSLKS